jgi:hypothetical protein
MTFRRPTIEEAIAALYDAADVAQPTAARCVTPLREMTELYLLGCNLRCYELDALTGRRAANFLLRRGGLAEAPPDAGDEPLAGFIHAGRRFGAIFVEQGDLVVRRRFSLAHELGHFLLHFQPLLAAPESDGDLFVTEALNSVPDEAEATPDDIAPSRVGGSAPAAIAASLPPLAQMEREANLFAAQLLMPAAVVRELAARHGDGLGEKDLIWRLSTEMLVSQAAMRWRLSELGLLTPEPASVN